MGGFFVGKTMNIENLRQQIQRANTDNFPLQEAIGVITTMPESDRWNAIRQEYQRATEAVANGKPVLFFLVDYTAAGASHLIRVIFSPAFAAEVVEIPAEDEFQGGRFPTVLHALEVVSTVHQLAGGNKDDLPRLKFMPSNKFYQVVQQVNQPEIVIMPLIVNPKKTNLVIFHTQARRIDPKAVALGYYQVLPRLDLEDDLLRHTMLVTPSNGLMKPDNRTEVLVDVWHHNQVGLYFNLLNVGRIRPWNLGEAYNPYSVVFRRFISSEQSPTGRANSYYPYAAHG